MIHKNFFLIIFAVFSVLLVTQVQAQSDKKPMKKEAFIAKRNAFITADLNLTPDEAAVFIPLCNELQHKLFELGHNYRKEERKLREKQNPTKEEYDALLDKMLDLKFKEAQLEKEYYNKFRKVLPTEKILKYRRSDMKFMRSLMNESRKGKKIKEK